MILAAAVPAALLLALFRRTLVALWHVPLVQRLRQSHWSLRVAALLVLALVTAYGGGKGGSTNAQNNASGGSAKPGGTPIDSGIIISRTDTTLLLEAMSANIQQGRPATQGLQIREADGSVASVPRFQALVPDWYFYSAQDSDQDGIPDLWEIWTHGDPLVHDNGLDRDGDGITDLYEFWHQTDPRTADTDGDGLSDYEEIYLYGTDPLVKQDFTVEEPDENEDGIPDYWEDSPYRWFKDSNDDGFDDSYQLPEGMTEAGTLCLSITSTRSVALVLTGDGYADAFLLPPSTDRVVRLSVPHELESLNLRLDPPQIISGSNSFWKARMLLNWDEVYNPEADHGRLPLGDGSVLGIETIRESTITCLTPPVRGVIPLSNGQPNVPEASIYNKSISLSSSGYICTKHGGSIVVTATPTNASPPFVWALTRTDSWIYSPETGSNFTFKATVAGTYRIKCFEKVENIFEPHVAWAETKVSVGCCDDPTTNIIGAAWDSSHNPTNALDHLPYVQTNINSTSHCAMTNFVFCIGFDHDKVKTRNLVLIPTNDPQSDETDHCLGLVWEENGTVDLFSLLAPGYEPLRSSLSFQFGNEAASTNQLWEYGARPADLAPTIRHVSLLHAGTTKPLDHLWLVVNSPMTYTNFADWKTASNNLSWTNGLPRPYDSIEITNGTPQDPEPGAPNLWAAPSRINPRSYMHHDAVFEMRSTPVGQHGHQATYNASGRLITKTIAAGTADFYTPMSISVQYFTELHRHADVRPFLRSLTLDGNPTPPRVQWKPTALVRPALYEGSYIRDYLQLRPTIPTGTQQRSNQ